ncbi:hypothetical protein RB213_000879, partial [Colletotrichum asianum]
AFPDPEAISNPLVISPLLPVSQLCNLRKQIRVSPQASFALDSRCCISQKMSANNSTCSSG